MCWGLGALGRLGNNSSATRPAPVAVTDLSSNVIAVSSGTSHSCALASDGDVNCWGDGSAGQLGNGGPSIQYTPETVFGFSSRVVDVSAGESHTCALQSEGPVMCWGRGGSGQLGSDVDVSFVPLELGSIIADAGFDAGTIDASL